MRHSTLYPHELIGEEVEIVASTNHSQLGMKGKIVDETKSTLRMRVAGVTKTVLKQTVTLKLTRNNRVIPGEMLTKRSEDRVKGRK